MFCVELKPRRFKCQRFILQQGEVVDREVYRCHFDGSIPTNFLSDARQKACDQDIGGEIVGNEGTVYIVAEGKEGPLEQLRGYVQSQLPATADFQFLFEEEDIDEQYNTFREFSVKLGCQACQ